MCSKNDFRSRNRIEHIQPEIRTNIAIYSSVRSLDYAEFLCQNGEAMMHTNRRGERSGRRRLKDHKRCPYERITTIASRFPMQIDQSVSIAICLACGLSRM